MKARFAGFTLSELLIALAILGVIAAFTIPKVLQAQQDSKYKSIAKEAAGAISAAYAAYKLDVGASSTTKSIDLTPYFNYVRVDTAGDHDNVYGYTNVMTCTSASPCLHMHNGSLIRFFNSSFSGTSATNAVPFVVDPNGSDTPDTSGTGPGKAVRLFLYYNGRIVSWNTLESGTVIEGVAWNPPPPPGGDPPWFGWD